MTFEVAASGMFMLKCHMAYRYLLEYQGNNLIGGSLRERPEGREPLC